MDGGVGERPDAQSRVACGRGRKNWRPSPHTFATLESSEACPVIPALPVAYLFIVRTTASTSGSAMFSIAALLPWAADF